MRLDSRSQASKVGLEPAQAIPSGFLPASASLVYQSGDSLLGGWHLVLTPQNQPCAQQDSSQQRC